MSDEDAGAESEASWFEYVDSDTDQVYYHNPKTGESVWTNPYAQDEDAETEAGEEEGADAPAEEDAVVEPEEAPEEDAAPEPEPSTAEVRCLCWLVSA